MKDFLERVHWSEIASLLGSGHPPLATQLLVANTIFLIAIIFRRLRRGSTGKNKTFSYSMQILLIGANFIILSQQNLFENFYQQSIVPLMRQVRDI